MKTLFTAVTALMLTLQAAWAQSGWQIADSLEASLTGIVFVDEQNGWIATESDTIFHTTDGGASWQVQTFGSDYVIEDMFFVDANTGWLAGDVGTILKTTNGGATWQETNTGVYDLIVSLFFMDADNGFAVGEGGLLLKTTDGGQNWSAQRVPNDTTENQSVYFVDADHGWIAGVWEESGVVLKSDDGGASWTTVFHDTAYGPFRAIVFTDTLNGWVSGMGGIILHTSDGGLSWQEQRKGLDNEQIRHMYFADENTGWAAGIKGYMLSTTDGGLDWDMTALPVNKKIMGMCFTDAEHGWAVTSAGGSQGGKGGGDGEEGEEGEGTPDSTATVGYILTYTPEETAIDDNSASGFTADDFVLYQNYPNPFNPVTVICYQIPKTTPVRLEVFDVLGKKVSTLVNNLQAAGSHSVEFNAEHLPSGIYYYRLQTETFTSVKQMLLLK